MTERAKQLYSSLNLPPQVWHFSYDFTVIRAWNGFECKTTMGHSLLFKGYLQRVMSEIVLFFQLTRSITRLYSWSLQLLQPGGSRGRGGPRGRRGLLVLHCARGDGNVAAGRRRRAAATTATGRGGDRAPGLWVQRGDPGGTRNGGGDVVDVRTAPASGFSATGKNMNDESTDFPSN